MPDKQRFTLVTFNSFGGINWTTWRRLSTLGMQLNQQSPTIACLQEVQSYPALRLLLRTTNDAFAYHAYTPAMNFPAGALLTLAQLPIKKVSFLRYSQQGALHNLTILDRFTQKGALVSELDWKSTPVVVINTHLIANYGANWSKQNWAAQMQQSQLTELATLITQQPADALVMVAGDFNLPRGSWLYEEFLEKTSMFDPLAGDTRPTYRPFPGVPTRYALPIDFIFLRQPASLHFTISADLIFTEQVQLITRAKGYLSDHIGVKVTVELQDYL